MAVSYFGNKIVARPSNSMSPMASVKFLAALIVVVMAVALFFTQLGAWMVLPFAGLEILAFAYTFYYIHLHSGDFESITIDEESIVVEKRNYKENTTIVFKRYWAQVNVRDVADKKGVNGKCGLFIGSHGKEVEFGRNFINDEQRAVLARELRQKIKDIH